MKSIGDKVLSFFIVREDDDEAVADDPIVVDAAAVGATAGEAKRESPDAKPAMSRTDAVKRPAAPLGLAEPRFDEVYRDADLSPEARARLTKVLELLATLPSEASIEVKRTIVNAALQAFSVPIDQIVQAASTSIAALDAHVADGRARCDERLAASRARVAELTAAIEAEQRAMTDAVIGRDRRAEATAAEKRRLSAVLEFWAPEGDVGRAPRLVRLK